MYTSTPADVPDPPFRFFEGLVLRLMPTWHAWGRKKDDLASESSLRGWYLVGIVEMSCKTHGQSWGLIIIVGNDFYTGSTQIAYIFSFIMLKCIWKILCEFHRYPSRTVHKREIWGTWDLVPRKEACSIRTCQFGLCTFAPFSRSRQSKMNCH